MSIIYVQDNQVFEARPTSGTYKVYTEVPELYKWIGTAEVPVDTTDFNSERHLLDQLDTTNPDSKVEMLYHAGYIINGYQGPTAISYALYTKLLSINLCITKAYLEMMQDV